MKERMEALNLILSEEKKMSRLNFVLSLLVALLFGVVVGFLMAPKRQKTSYYGCYSGNNHCSTGSCDDDCCCDDCCDCDCDDCDCEGGQCCEECEEERCCGETHYCGKDVCCCEDDWDDEEEEQDVPEIVQTNEKEYIKIN